MSTVNVLFVSSEDTADCKPSKAEILRGIVADKLTTAAQEILAVVERTVSGYEEEAAGLRQEIERQRKHLDLLLQPRVALCRIDDQIPVCDPTAGGAELPEENEQQKYEPSWSNGADMETSWAAGGCMDDPLAGDRDAAGLLISGGVDELLTGGDDMEGCLIGEDHVEASRSPSSGVEDSVRQDILGHTEEEESEDVGESAEEPGRSTSHQDDLRVRDHQIPNTRSQCVTRNSRSLGPTVHLRVCLLKDSHTEVLKKGVLKSPMKDLRCPRGLQEPDFLDLLRSTFPQLTGQFHVFTTDGTKTLTPLKVRTLTPEEIKRSIKSRSAIYISTKEAKKPLTSTEQLPPQQRKDEATFNMRNDENVSHASSVEKVENNAADRLSSYSRWQQQIEREDDGEQRGFLGDFSALSSVLPAAESKGDNGDDDDEVDEDDRDDEWKPNKNDEELRGSDAEQNSSKTRTKKQVERSGVKATRRKWMQPTDNSDAPLSCKVCQTLHGTTNMLIKHSWSHVDEPQRLCGACGEHSESAEELRTHLKIHNDVEDARSLDILGHAEEEDGEDEGEESAEDPDYQIQNISDQSVKRTYSRRGLLSLKVCLLKDTHTEILKKGVLKCPMRNLKCPRGLQEPDFVDLLRSTFPQLTGQFDVFTTDGTKKLTPLNVRTLTPEEIKRSIKSALYISTKRADKSLTCTEQQPPLPSPQKKDRPHASSVEKVEGDKADSLSSDSRRRQQMEEDGEQCGISDNFSALSSVRSAAERDGDSGDYDEMDEDDECKPDKNNEELSKAEPNSSNTIRHQRVGHSGVETKTRTLMQSSPKTMTDNSDAPLSCKVCQTLCRSMNMLIKHSWSHVDDPESLCGVCGEQSESVEELRRHFESHQKSDGCDIFLHASTLNKHASVHTGQRPYKCDVCHKAYRFEISLRKHLREHGENKPHKCDVCNKSFGLKQQLMIHSRTHTGEEPHRCKKSFTNFPSLSQHKFCRVGERFYSCLVCGKCFLTPKHLKQHAHIHTDRDKPYLCDICCKTFSTYENLKAHLRTHSKKKIICSECGKELSSQASLNRHMLIHTGERPYECSECGRTFNTQSILNNHLITHSGIKLFVCRVCGKSSARKGSLTVHMRTHTGEKPYQCTVCSRRFSQSHCVKTHMKRHQGEEKSALDGLKF